MSVEHKVIFQWSQNIVYLYELKRIVQEIDTACICDCYVVDTQLPTRI
jgi:hypothetical protein